MPDYNPPNAYGWDAPFAPHDGMSLDKHKLTKVLAKRLMKKVVHRATVRMPRAKKSKFY